MKKSPKKSNLPAIIEPIEVEAEEIKRRKPKGVAIRFTTGFEPDPGFIEKLTEELNRRKRLDLPEPTWEEVKALLPGETNLLR